MNALPENLSLGWISLDLDHSIDRARRSFEAYLSSPELQQSVDKLNVSLQSAHEAAEIFAAAELATAHNLTVEIGDLIQQLIEDQHINRQDAYQSVIGGFNQLLNYLSRLKRSGVDDPVLVLPVINDLRVVAGKAIELPDEQFVMNLPEMVFGETALVSVVDSVNWPELGQWLASTKVAMSRLDEHPDDSRGALIELVKTICTLDASAIFSEKDTAYFDSYQACKAVIDSAVRNSYQLSMAAKYCLKNSLDILESVAHAKSDGKNELNTRQLQDQFRKLMYCLAVDGNTEQYALQFDKYGLVQALQLEQGKNLLRLGTPDVETIDIVLKGLLDDTELLTNALQGCIDEPALFNDCSNLQEMAKNLLYTMQLTQLHEFNPALSSIIKTLGKISSAGQVETGQIETVAAHLFEVEQLLKEKQYGSGKGSGELTALEQIGVALKNLSKILTECIELHASSSNSSQAISERLVPLSGAVKSLASTAEFIGSHALYAALKAVEQYAVHKIDAPLAADDPASSVVACEILDEALAIIVSYIFACQHSSHALVEKSLQQINVLLELPIEEADDSLVSDNDAITVQDGLKISQNDVGTSHSDETTVQSDQAIIQNAESVYQLIPLAVKIDDEIAEIFLEEAEEVFATLVENYAELQTPDRQQQALAEVRRAYHTLKGSGRMAGAEHIGDVAWAIENLLNKVIEKSIELDELCIGLVGEANSYMQVLVEDFQQRLQPYLPAMQSMIARANQLVAGDATVTIGDALTLLESARAGVTTEPDVDNDSLVDIDECDIDAGLTSELEVAGEPANMGPDVESATTYDNVNDSHDIGVAIDIDTAESEFEREARHEPDADDPEESAIELEPDLQRIFTEEAELQLALIESYVALLQTDPQRVPDENVERAFHTLAGGARIANIQAIADIMAPAETLVSHVRNRGIITAEQQTLIQRAQQWLSHYFGDTGVEPAVTKQLAEDFNRVITQALSDSEQPAEAGRSVLHDLCSATLNAEPLLKSWRTALTAPETLPGMLKEFEQIASAEQTPEALRELCQAMMEAYRCCNEHGLHYRAYRLLLEAHADLENMLDCIAAGQSVSAADSLVALGDLVNEDRALSQITISDHNMGSGGESADSQLDREIVAIFLEESQDLIEEVESSVQSWLKDHGDLSYLESLLRPLHTIKGGARMAGLNAVGDICHAFESLLQQARSGDVKINAGFFKKIGAHLADLTLNFSEFMQVEASENATAETDKNQTKDDKRPAEAVRVTADLLDQLVSLAGETSISRSLIEEKVNDFTRSIDEIDSTVERLKEQLRRLEIETEAQINFRKEQVEIEGLEEFDPLEMDRYSQFQQLSKSLVESASDLKDLKGTLKEKTRDIETLLLQQSRVNTELQEGLMRTRTVPLSRAIVPRLRRTVRQVSGELNKPVTFDIGNTDGELDRSVIERMVAPLEHVIRNALDHGIEPASQRKKAGKPETGSIRLEIHREGSDVVLQISDDGKGIDVEAVRKKAISLGLIDKDDKLTDEQIKQLIMSAGFSTASKLTQISGRGVGMDVVQKEITELGGSLELLSEQGIGTTFIFRLPFTVSMNRALLISVGGEALAIPLDSIEGIVRVSPYELEEYYGDEAVDFMYAGQKYDFRYLGTLINGSKPVYSSEMVGALPVLLVRSGEQMVAFQVDRLLGSREIVVKSLGSQFSQLQGISGATVLGDGSVVMIADLSTLVRNRAVQMLEREAMSASKAVTRERALAMVVDDSVTVRKVTTRLLERNGFDVVTAKDGLDAMEKLEDIRPDFILLDIEMPRLDGFEVITRIRHDEKLGDLPVIMITSRTGEKHRERALSLGASEFLGKPYQDKQLLGTISRLLPQLDGQLIAAGS